MAEKPPAGSATPANSGRSGGRKPPVGRRFQKGKSGNPSGRPPLPPGYREAFDVLEPLSWKAMEEILLNPRHKDRGDVAKYVTNRRRGSPTQRAEITGADGKPLEVTGPPDVIAALKRMTGEGEEG
jgi:hypothetical protein